MARQQARRPPGGAAIRPGWVLHYGITDVHPFADGNGRAARLFQTAMLMKADVLPGRMFSFERYYADDRDAYYGALRSVRRLTFNMEVWLEYFLRGLAEEYERVAETVGDLSSLVSATRYLFSAAVRPAASGERRGRPAKWNDTLIERELRSFLSGRTSWPSPAEFRGAGRGDLYAAASRPGGIARWRRIFGL